MRTLPREKEQCDSCPLTVKSGPASASHFTHRAPHHSVPTAAAASPYHTYPARTYQYGLAPSSFHLPRQVLPHNKSFGIMSGEKDETSTPDSSKCPVKSETWRHVLYVGGMVALHAGLGATLASDKSKGSKCPIGEWGKHAVYTGGIVALVAMQWNKSPAIAETKEDKEATTTSASWYEACPVNETWRHVVYVVATVGAVAIWNARKK